MRYSMSTRTTKAVTAQNSPTFWETSLLGTPPCCSEASLVPTLAQVFLIVHCRQTKSFAVISSLRVEDASWEALVLWAAHAELYMCHKLSGAEDVSKMQAELVLVYFILIQTGFGVFLFCFLFSRRCKKLKNRSKIYVCIKSTVPKCSVSSAFSCFFKFWKEYWWIYWPVWMEF